MFESPQRNHKDNAKATPAAPTATATAPTKFRPDPDDDDDPPPGLGALALPETVPFLYPRKGGVMFIAVRLTGAGRLCGVKDVFTPGLRKTDPPPAPWAEVLGAGKGTKRVGLRGPGMVVVRLVRGISSPVTFTFWYPIASATKLHTFDTVLFVS